MHPARPVAALQQDDTDRASPCLFSQKLHYKLGRETVARVRECDARHATLLTLFASEPKPLGTRTKPAHTLYMKRTSMEESFQEWKLRTEGTREEWLRSTAAEWERIVASLKESGHWHDGKSCAEAKCAA